MIEPRFLTPDEVLRLHDRELERHGGQAGERDLVLLFSAIGQPEASFGGEWLHEGLFHMAAAYAFHIAENQPFLDGNKRTGLAAALTFLKLNGENLRDPEGRLVQAMMQIAGKTLDKQGLAALLRDLTEPRT